MSAGAGVGSATAGAPTGPPLLETDAMCLKVAQQERAPAIAVFENRAMRGKGTAQ